VWVALGFVVAIATAVRVAFIGQPMRYDEAFSYLHYASQPWRTTVSDYSFPNNHFLNSVEMHAVWRVLGDSPEALRLPALVAGILLVPAVYVLGRLIYNEAAALWGAALSAASSVLVQYSVNARGYSTGVLLVVIALAAATWAARSGLLWAWVVLGVSSVLAVYCVPTMAYGIAVAFAWAVVVAGRDLRGRLRGLLITGAAATAVGALLYLPARGDPGWNVASDYGVTGLGDKLDVIQRTWEQWTDALPLSVAILLAAAFICALVVHGRVAREPVPLVAVAIPVTLIAVVALPQSPFPRTYLYLLPIVLLTVGAGLAWAISELAERVRLRPAVANAVAAVAVSAALAVVFASKGDDALTIDSPRSDEGIGAVIEPGRPFMSSLTTSDPVSFDLRKEGLGPPAYQIDQLKPRPRRVLLVVAPDWDPPVESVLRETGLEAAGAGEPKLLRDTRWLDSYEVELTR